MAMGIGGGGDTGGELSQQHQTHGARHHSILFVFVLHFVSPF